MSEKSIIAIAFAAVVFTIIGYRSGYSDAERNAQQELYRALISEKRALDALKSCLIDQKEAMNMVDQLYIETKNKQRVFRYSPAKFNEDSLISGNKNVHLPFK